MKTEGNDTIAPTTGDIYALASHVGLTKREYFAAMAMQGLLASDYVKNGLYASHEAYPNVGEIACRVADDLIEKLNQ